MDKYEALKKYYGFDSFRNIQEACIDSILDGKDTFVIMATGGGKSLIFQIPGLILDGLTLVISPLISLMQDQVLVLKHRQIEAETINSNIDYLTEKQIYEKIKKRKLKFLYIAPERLENKHFLEVIKDVPISQIALDESHTISWGFDFRPSYLKIKQFIDSLKKRPVISCFTATASDYIIKVIKDSLEIDPVFFQSSFDRPNLYYETITTNHKKEFLLDFLHKHNTACGIIYTLTRKKAEEIFQMLLELNYKVSLYHGGLDEKIRATYQDNFLGNQSNIMVCTNSFGMGIDKSNIRFIINYDLPESIEDLTQQQGRCSRDGKPGICILLFNESDLYINEYFINQVEDNLNLTKEEVKKLKKIKRQKLRDVINYATTRKCLHQYLVTYFGELYISYCDNCSNCKDSYEYIDVLEKAKKIIAFIKIYNYRFGANLIAECFCGIKSEGVVRNRLSYSPYFNRYKMSKDRVKDIIYKMLDDAYLVKSEGHFPVIGLGVKKDELTKLEEYRIRVYKENSIVDEILSHKIPLKERLIDFAKTKAHREGLPRYMVLTEESIQELIQLKPKTKAELANIKGIGEKKLNKYGTELLDILNNK